MSLFTRVSTQIVSDELSFLHEVNYEKYRDRLAVLSSVKPAGMAVTQSEKTTSKEATVSEPLMRLTNFGGRLDDLRRKLASGNANSVWIDGLEGTGKTALLEAFLRAKAEKRLSRQMMVKRDFLFDVSAFFVLPREEWIKKFMACVNHVAECQGMLIIDHIDDFVKMAGSDAGRAISYLVSKLENNKSIQSIIVSEAKNRDSILEVATGVKRQFKQLRLDDEPNDEELKAILMAQFRRLEQIHNVDYMEEVATEIIRCLKEFPNQGFEGKRPENAITFADRVGAFVYLNKYAEPPEVAELREKVGILEDRVAVLSSYTDQDKEAHEESRLLLQEAQNNFDKAHAAWQEKFAALFKAQGNFDQLNNDLLELRNKKELTDEERGTFSTLTRAYEPGKKKLEDLEMALYPTPPKVRAAHVRAVFSLETGIPLSEMSEDVLIKLDGLIPYLKTQIFGQDTPVNGIARAYRRRELKLNDKDKIAGAILVAGGTGLGKTEIAFALARFDQGKDDAEPVMISCNEYTDKEAAGRMFGSERGTIGYGEDTVFTPIIKKRKAIVLFDEVDKCDPGILKALMQALDKKRLTLTTGEVVYFDQVIAIFATNAITASEFTKEQLADQDKHQNEIKQTLKDYRNKDTGRAQYLPELLGRIQQVYVYNDLTDYDVLELILQKAMRKLATRYAEKGIFIDPLDHESAQALLKAYHVMNDNGRSPVNIAENQVSPVIEDYWIAEYRKAKAANLPTLLNQHVQVRFDGNIVTLQRTDEQPTAPVSVPPVTAAVPPAPTA